jgi:hypothetical protein
MRDTKFGTDIADRIPGFDVAATIAGAHDELHQGR